MALETQCWHSMKLWSVTLDVLSRHVRVSFFLLHFFLHHFFFTLHIFMLWGRPKDFLSINIGHVDARITMSFFLLIFDYLVRGSGQWLVLYLTCIYACI